VSTEHAHAAAEAAARRSYGKLIAFLAARTRDVAAAEDALAQAFESALRDWPEHGVPTSPEAWLLTAARRSLIDAARRRKTRDDAVADLLLLADEADDGERRAIPDDRLLLMFACAHPAIEAGVRAPLMLQTTLGFDAATIASAFLVAPSTMGQRLVRAKAKIKRAGIPFRLPDHDDLAGRLDAVLEAIYAAYTEGWSDPLGTESRRRNLAQEGIWLGELVVNLLPDEPEALGLLALMLLHDARRASRVDAAGDLIPLEDQDRTQWDRDAIDEGVAVLDAAIRRGQPGAYQVQAAIAACHATAPEPAATDWAEIAMLYRELSCLVRSPVVELNRAVAVAMADGPEAGLALVDALDASGALDGYHLLPATRADLLRRLGRRSEAAAAYRAALALTTGDAERRYLERRLPATEPE
jgi:RNA polymerase sigma-70 factor (ECF subfamily)